MYQNGKAVCPLGHCLDRSLSQVVEAISTYNKNGRTVSVFNSARQMQGPAAAQLAGILGTDVQAPPLVMDVTGIPVNQGCEGVLSSLVIGSGLLDGSISRIQPKGLTLLFWNQAPANSTTTFPGDKGYIGWRDARVQGETFWGLYNTPIKVPRPRR